MHDPIEVIITDLRADVESAVAVAAERLRAAAQAPQEISRGILPFGKGDCLRPTEAVRLTGISRTTLFELCRKFSADPEFGFSFQLKKGGDYLISKSRLLRCLEAHPPRRRHSERLRTK